VLVGSVVNSPELLPALSSPQLVASAQLNAASRVGVLGKGLRNMVSVLWGRCVDSFAAAKRK
jgi:hypothetical protein